MNYLTNEEVLQELSYVEKCRKILNENFVARGKRPVFFLHSFGCQGNVSEGEKIRGILLEMGYVEGFDLKTADFVIFNTCAVRESAQNRVIGNLGIVVHYKRNFNNDMIVAICGCMVQQKHVENKIKKIFTPNGVDLIFGTHQIHKFAHMVYEVLIKKNVVVSTENCDGIVAEGLPVARQSRLKALVPISYGCNNFCSYCIVPYVKGRERSRRFDIVVDEVKNLIKQGYKEITLLGQNVNSYGFDFGDGPRFEDLLIVLNEIPGNFRIRFLTSHPKNLTEKLIDSIASCEKVCNHIHLPVQSGSNKILKAMNRNYDLGRYLYLVDYAKSKIRNLVLTTDVIVGFPGETYDDFLKTLELIKRVRFASIFNFIYSRREGTKACEMNDFVSKNEKTRWLIELIDVQAKISEEVNKSFVGKNEQVLFENVLKTDETILFGRTSGNLLVHCKNDGKSLNQFRQVKIKDSTRTFLVGEII